MSRGSLCLEISFTIRGVVGSGDGAVTVSFSALVNSKARAGCACSWCGMGIFGHFNQFSLSLSLSLFLSKGDGSIETEILSHWLKEALKAKSTDQPLHNR